MNKATRAKYANTLTENLVKGSFECSFQWPILTTECHQYETSSVVSPPFSLCGTDWLLTVFPVGTDIDSDSMAIHLTSLADHAIVCSYELTIVNRKPKGSNFSWKDPEGIVLFSAAEDGNNEWGSDEIITQEELRSEPGFTSHGKFFVEVTIEVHKTDGFEYHPSENMVRDEDIVEREELMERAKDDVDALVKKLTKGKDLDIQKKQEDRIVRTLVGGKK